MIYRFSLSDPAPLASTNSNFFQFIFFKYLILANFTQLQNQINCVTSEDEGNLETLSEIGSIATTNHQIKHYYTKLFVMLV